MFNAIIREVQSYNIYFVATVLAEVSAGILDDVRNQFRVKAGDMKAAALQSNLLIAHTLKFLSNRADGNIWLTMLKLRNENKIHNLHYAMLSPS